MSLGYLAAIGAYNDDVPDAGLIVPGTTAEIALSLAGAAYAYWRWRSVLGAIGTGWALAKFTFPAAFGLIAEAYVRGAMAVERKEAAARGAAG